MTDRIATAAAQAVSITSSIEARVSNEATKQGQDSGANLNSLDAVVASELVTKASQDESELGVEEIVIDDISIDGMCGVY